jgi:two-component system nitrogen regulation response regulator NtrX
MRKHVLVCDDDIDIIEIVTLLLEKEGHQVSAVRDCESIWEVIEAKTPDLIFMDLWMQKMGGGGYHPLAQKKSRYPENTRDIAFGLKRH